MWSRKTIEAKNLSRMCDFVVPDREHLPNEKTNVRSEKWGKKEGNALRIPLQYACKNRFVSFQCSELNCGLTACMFLLYHVRLRDKLASFWSRYVMIVGNGWYLEIVSYFTYHLKKMRLSISCAKQVSSPSKISARSGSHVRMWRWRTTSRRTRRATFAWWPMRGNDYFSMIDYDYGYQGFKLYLYLDRRLVHK